MAFHYVKTHFMKKVIRAISALLAIGVFILATQISCQKTNAQATTNTIGAANLILYGKNVQVPGSTTDSSGNAISVWSYQFYVANNDGTNPRTIPIILPTGLYAAQGGYLTPGGQTLIFTANNQSGTSHSIYSCGIDGSNLKKLLDVDSNTQLLGAY